MKVRRRWPARLVAIATFVAGALSPIALTPAQGRAVMVAAPLDPAVETVTRFLTWRAPEALEPGLRRKVAVAVVEEARRASLDPLYILAVMEVESDFSPDAVSYAGARGLMQLTDVTKLEMARRSPLPESDEPEAVLNVRIGVRYLASLERRYHRRDRALAAWNAGPGAVDRELREQGRVPDRWLAFARKVKFEHRQLRRSLGAELPEALAASRSAPVAAQ